MSRQAALQSAPIKSDPTDTKQIILDLAAPLFSENGYDTVSMRVLAKEVGITPAALYYHYPDKGALYNAVLQNIFTEKANELSILLDRKAPPEIRLELLIAWLARLYCNDRVLTRLLHRELLDGDQAQIKLLTEDVFKGPLLAIEELMHLLAPDRDARLSAISVIALCLAHYELMPIFEHLPGKMKLDRDQSIFISHVKTLVLSGLQGHDSSEGEE